MVRAVARLSKIYWNPECYPKDFEGAEQGWLPAAVLFASTYAYERAGAAPAYRTIAARALQTAGDGVARPDRAFAQRVWDRFEELARQAGVGVNPKRNPLNAAEAPGSIPLTRFIASLVDNDHNILTWSRTLIAADKAKDALEHLQTIRGIGEKIASFFLRDVARQYQLQETPGICFQPADIWIKRVAEIWSAALGRKVRGYGPSAELFVELADATGVRGSDLNAGAWVLGARLADGDLHELATSKDALQARLWRHIRCHEAAAGVLRALVADEG